MVSVPLEIEKQLEKMKKELNPASLSLEDFTKAAQEEALLSPERMNEISVLANASSKARHPAYVKAAEKFLKESGYDDGRIATTLKREADRTQSALKDALSSAYKEAFAPNFTGTTALNRAQQEWTNKEIDRLVSNHVKGLDVNPLQAGGPFKLYDRPPLARHTEIDLVGIKMSASFNGNNVTVTQVPRYYFRAEEYSNYQTALTNIQKEVSPPDTLNNTQLSFASSELYSGLFAYYETSLIAPDGKGPNNKYTYFRNSVTGDLPAQATELANGSVVMAQWFAHQGQNKDAGQPHAAHTAPLQTYTLKNGDTAALLSAIEQKHSAVEQKHLVLKLKPANTGLGL